MLKAPRGTKDVLPKESYKWQYVENLMRQIASDFGFSEIRTPTFEFTELFQRGVGDTTDIVQKEMYTFDDRGGRSITLKPEGTAGAVRALLENSLYAEALPIKMFYISPVFRYDKPQKGRYREHHQFGVEVFGSESASVDAEIIGIAMELYRRLGIINLEVHINSIGCPICRKNYQEELKKYIGQNTEKLCNTCQNRFERNPLRILDCKEDECKLVASNAPKAIDYLCDECKTHFDDLKENLSAIGIEYIVDPLIVRGLDYYTKTVFEIMSREHEDMPTVCGGGRYDGLVEELGGNPMPAAGFGMGIERLLLTLENNKIKIPQPKGLDLFIATLGDKARKIVPTILSMLRANGVSCDTDHMDKSLKGQLKYADKIGARFSMVLGDDEIDSEDVVIKDMTSGEKHQIKLGSIVERMKLIK